jgi:hypothetical protein
MLCRILARVSILLGTMLCAGPALAGPTCDEWLAFSPADQATAMRAFIQQAVPKSVPQATVSCLHSIEPQIALHATELCKRDGGDFIPAASTAITTAIEYCQSR